jgi:aquaporin Z
MPDWHAEWERYAAEFLGAFVLVFGGCTAIVAAEQAQVPVLIVVPFAFGLALLAGLYAFGEVSGGHYNPAVSLAMLLDKRLQPPDFVGYVLAQVSGAIVACLLLALATSRDDVATTGTFPSSNGTAFVMELAFTAIFVAVILQASMSLSFGNSALLAIPFTLVFVQFAAIPFSGASVNPARTLGPAIVGNEWDGILIYLTAPFIGGALAWAAHEYVVLRRVVPPEAPVAEALQEPAEAITPEEVRAERELRENPPS